MTTTTATAELVTIDAADAIIENNVRTAADLDPSFVASIKRHGVLTPTFGYRDENGQIIVRDGQMRTLAAREAGAPLPVLVADRATTEAKRLAEQLVANDQRTALKDADRLAAYRQMELAGLSATTIAKETSTKRADVTKTLRVAKSETATAAVTTGTATFDQALILAEFEDDEAALETLRRHIGWGYDTNSLEHLATRLRRDKERAAAVLALTATLTAAGKTVIEDDAEHAVLHILTAATDDVTDYEERHPLTEEEHAACPGHAYLITAYGEVAAKPVCTTPAQHNFRNPSTAPAPEPTEEDAEARKAARRELIANNKAWDAAEEVRRGWLIEFFQRRTMPKDAAQFLAQALTRHSMTRDASGAVDATDLLGIETSGWRPEVLGNWAAENPTKATHIALAVVFAGFENTSSRYWWRTPDEHSRAYLTQVASWGYTLSDVERIAAGQPTNQPTE